MKIQPPPMPEPEGLIAYPAAPYEPEWIGSLDAYSESQLTARDQAWQEKVQPLVEALKDVADRIEKSENWWMDCPDRGGFDVDLINSALATLTKE